ncbi:hypothetical protein [Saccharopolyspora pogona]|uniref:hypothetical protein n=1 Tax=Saccharopolyspora pogona TaxID=333966 RepID=UPI0016877AB0|nr:hypothetical protein [Saccharopolyspora pogona]
MPEPLPDSPPPRKKLDLTQLLTLGAVLVSLVFAIPQAITAQATLEATRSESSNLQQQQITERFSTAIEQLGSDKLQIRLGGIYALERIAHDSDHHPQRRQPPRRPPRRGGWLGDRPGAPPA